jgi:hypothetical protein
VKSFILHLPKKVRLRVPTDYAKYCHGDPVAVELRRVGRGLSVSWDQDFILLCAQNGSVRYARKSIRQIYIDPCSRIMRWELIELRVEVTRFDDANLSDSLSLLYAEKKNERAFYEFMCVMNDLEIPGLQSPEY